MESSTHVGTKILAVICPFFVRNIAPSYVLFDIMRTTLYESIYKYTAAIVPCPNPCCRVTDDFDWIYWVIILKDGWCKMQEKISSFWCISMGNKYRMIIETIILSYAAL